MPNLMAERNDGPAVQVGGPHMTESEAVGVIGLLDLDAQGGEGAFKKTPPVPEPKKKPAAPPASPAPAAKEEETDGEEEVKEQPSEDDESPDDDESPAEEQDEDSEQDEGEEPKTAFLKATHKVPVDGEELEVTGEEALKGYMRTAAFTKKTQAVAEEKKAAQAKQAEADAKRTEYAEGLDILIGALKEMAPPEPNWDKLRKENPGEYAARKEEQREYQEKLIVAQQERQKVAQEAAEANQKKFAESLQEGFKQLLTVFPEWTKPEVFKEAVAEISQHAEAEYGYTKDELQMLVDPRAVRILHDAMQYRKMRQRAGKAKEIVTTKRKAAPVIEPGGPPAPPKPRNAFKDAFRRSKSGKVNDAVDAVGLILQNE